MAAETIRIEIPVEMVDKTEPELSNIVKKISKFDKSTEKTQKGLEKWAKEKYEVFLEAKEKISPIIKTLGSGLKSIAGRAWNVTMKAADFVTAPVRGIINLLKNPVFQVGAVLGVSVGLKDTIDTYKNFEAAMSKVQAISGATESDMKKLTEKAEEMGYKTKFSATESAEALNYMAMAGWKTEDMLNGIEGIMYLAGASGEDLATTSDIVTDAITAFGMTAGDASHFADVLAVASSNANTDVSKMGETFKYVGAASGALGYSVDDAALAIGLMANSGIKASQAGTELNSIFTRLATNTNGAKSAIEKLGVNFFNSKGEARAFSEVLVELRAATKDMTEEEKINFANTVAGTRAQSGLLAMLNATSKDFKKLQGAIEDADGAALDMYEIMQDNLQGSLDSLNSKMESVKLSFGKRLAPYIQDFAEWLGNQMPALSKGLDEFMDFVDRKVEKVKKKFEEVTAGSEWQNADFFGKVKIAWDEFIVEPFSDWWNGTGKAKVAEIAANIGSGIGSGLKHGIMALLGIDMSDTVNEASSIGTSFARGFSEGFDFDLIKSKLWEGFKNLISDAGKLLPGGESAGLSSVISAALLAKLASPLIGLGRGTFSLGRAIFATPAGGGTSIAGSVLGSAASGTGMMGGLASLGIIGTKLTSTSIGGFSGLLGSQAAGMSGAGLIGAGALGVGGAVAGGMSVISGAMDAYKAVKSEDQKGSQAYGTSAGLKVGGTAAGAAIGTLILPGLGTAIGAGIGGIAGYIAGNKVKESYEEELEEAEKAAANAQKVLKATGLSIDDVKFKNKELTKAMHDSEVSAEEFALMFQEDCAAVMKEAFGDVKLSLSEVKELAEKITFGDMKEGLEAFNTAAADTESALATLKNSASDLKKQRWKVSLGVELSESEQENYRQSLSNYVQNALDYVSDRHYEAIVAVDLLTDGSMYHTSFDSYYGEFETKINEFMNTLNAVFEDGVISTENIRLHDGTLQLSEAQEIDNLLEQIANITDKVSDAQSEAKLDLIQMKYKGADAESFASLQEELKAYTDNEVAVLDQAYISAVTPLKAKLKDENPTGGARKRYEDQLQALKNDYMEKLNSLNTRVQSFNLDFIANAAWPDSIDGILPDLEGDLSERLSEAMRNAIAIDPDVEGWTQEDVRKWFGMENIDASVFEDIFVMLKQTALATPEGIKEEIVQNFKDQIPTVEEIKEAIDWDNMTSGDWKQLMESVKGPTDGESYCLPNEDDKKQLKEQFGESFDNIKQLYAEALHDALESNADNETLNTFMEQYMSGKGADVSELSFDDTGAAVIKGVGSAIMNADMTEITSAVDTLKENTDGYVNTAFETGVSTTMPVNVTAQYNLLNPNAKISVSDGGSGTTTITTSISSYAAVSQGNTGKNAAGGFVTGKQLSWLAEEGYGEFVIPTNPSRRTRALELYEQAGNMLGVGAHAAGGFVGGSRDVFPSENYAVRGENEGNEITFYGNNENTGKNSSNSEMPYYDSGSFSIPDTAGNGMPIQIDVNMSPEINIQASEGGDAESIADAVMGRILGIADEIGGEMASRLMDVFSNMPMAGA